MKLSPCKYGMTAGNNFLLWRKMVSTRGPKFKFTEGERVLCYEPDPSKAKVLYDSKVLEVIVNKDQRGRKAVEFLIHFQGWNSSWDRYVTEDFVLKDTEENRQLQKDLAQKAQLQLCSNYRRGAYLYRRDRTKRRRNLSDRINDTLERQKGRRRISTSGTSNGSTSASMDTDRDSGTGDDDDDEDDLDDHDDEDESVWGHQSSDESSGMDEDAFSEDASEERIPLSISSGLKRLLEHDYNLVTKNNKVLQLPAEPNVVTILEGFVKHCAVNQLCNSHPSKRSKNGHSHRYSYKYLSHKKIRDMETICRNLNICKEVADGLRVYFDFTLSQLLLYSQEKSQFKQVEDNTFIPKSLVTVKREIDSGGEGSPNAMSGGDDDHEVDQSHDRGKHSRSSTSNRTPIATNTSNNDETAQRKRSLRSSFRNAVDVNPAPSTSNGISTIEPSNSYSQMSSVTSNSSHCSTIPPAPHPTESNATENASCESTETTNAVSPRSNAVLSQIMTWRLVPASLYETSPSTPSLVYGATHLARLFVRLPELLYTSSMPHEKLKMLTSHLETFMGYLEEHTEWFEDHHYKENLDHEAPS